MSSHYRHAFWAFGAFPKSGILSELPEDRPPTNSYRHALIRTRHFMKAAEKVRRPNGRYTMDLLPRLAAYWKYSSAARSCDW